jgi:hypothetical protein
MTIADQTETSDYGEMRAAMFRAVELLEAARGQLASAEAFAESGTAGQMRDDVLEQVKLARQAAWMAALHTGSARNSANH